MLYKSIANLFSSSSSVSASTFSSQSGVGMNQTANHATNLVSTTVKDTNVANGLVTADTIRVNA
ncbi:hypothetical protein PPL_12578 [Heterostelium album PN500]|uniref:Uncharacterized protein n=1 Tax=Heterostelium pallidum (strain ATCC 26659 / Pp 5 / PN500) TaxID=670386 RepID=D3BN03_HETP5|nr:hypothetical protein PPL_12578 [Heterostelium album PN500]EFA77365.1 hypothetical protein PPL_12578 [Heterostelium album PN500]|eukprot:XP_020429494.1 hypothetical protein PPL_12578 [Heterostelium album PN500]